MQNYRLDDKKLLELNDKIDEWKKNGEITLVSLTDDPFDGIFKVPTADHMKLANTQKNDMDKNKQLCLDCVLYPKPEIFLKILEERSGIVVPIATKLVELSGVTQDVIVKKL